MKKSSKNKEKQSVFSEILRSNALSYSERRKSNTKQTEKWNTILGLILKKLDQKKIPIQAETKIVLKKALLEVEPMENICIPQNIGS